MPAIRLPFLDFAFGPFGLVVGFLGFVVGLFRLSVQIVADAAKLCCRCRLTRAALAVLGDISLGCVLQVSEAVARARARSQSLTVPSSLSEARVRTAGPKTRALTN
jgi:hypothetical protein